MKITDTVKLLRIPNQPTGKIIDTIGKGKHAQHRVEREHNQKSWHFEHELQEISNKE